MTRLHVRLWVDGALVVDEDIHEGNPVSAATRHGELGAACKESYRLEISDPDGVLPTYAATHRR